MNRLICVLLADNDFVLRKNVCNEVDICRLKDELEALCITVMIFEFVSIRGHVDIHLGIASGTCDYEDDTTTDICDLKEELDCFNN